MVHIAIIDDNAVDRLLLSEQLQQDMKRRGIPYEVSEFTGGSEFLEQFAPGRFQIAFLDIYMGEPDGFSVAKVLYKKDPLCKIIFLTSSDEYVLDSFSVNATYYLLKNSKQSKFRQALDFCFPKKRMTPSPCAPAMALPLFPKALSCTFSIQDALSIFI